MPHGTVNHARPITTARPAVDGKFFRVGGRRFPVRGVTYGTFADGGFGELEQIKLDFAAMAEMAVNTVRTYTLPPPEVADLAAEHDLMLLAGVWWDDPRYLHPPSTAAWDTMAAAARHAVGDAVAQLSRHPALLGFLVGNEIPGDVVRWHGRRMVERLLASLCEAGKAADADALIGYANYPTTGYLDTSCFDFAAVNVFLEDERAFRHYLAQLQVDVGARPLVLTELGLDAASHGEQRQAAVLDWQLRAALEHGAAGACVFAWTDEWVVGGQPVQGWSFGLTTAARVPKPALTAVGVRYRGGLLGTRPRWPKVSVVVCAYQEEATIAACLASLEALDYPDFEVLVVDDGSSDATGEVARTFPFPVLNEGRLGLSSARNLGLAHATGQVVAYLDADARADPDWLTYLVIGLDAPAAAAVGGPNLPPPDDPFVAQCIARAPGGPVHVLVDNQRAEHVPGCNMAFRRERLIEIGGFDPAYRTAGDDVDACWKLLDRGHEVRFHPAAVVWHQPRRGVRAFWRQQVGYGRAEALVARNHPDRFDATGRARWRGTVYGPSGLLAGRAVVYAGELGRATYQRLYRSSRELGALPALGLLFALGVLAAVDPHLWPLPALAAAAVIATWCAQGVRVARRDRLPHPWRAGALIGALHLLQPVARLVGHLRSQRASFPPSADLRARFPRFERVEGRRYRASGVRDGDREPLLVEVRDRLRVQRLRAVIASDWDEADVACDGPLLWRAALYGCVRDGVADVRIVTTVRRPRVAAAAGALLGLVAAWSLGVVVEAFVALLLAVLAERVVLLRRVHRALTTIGADP